MTINPENQPPSPYTAPAGNYGSPQTATNFPQAPGYAGGPVQDSPFAHWGKRVGASVVDSVVIGVLPTILVTIALATGEHSTTARGETTVEPTSAGLVMSFVSVILYLGLWVWNRLIRQGKTGQSIGKKVLNIRLVGRVTGEPVGAGVALLREICHVVDGFFYLGYLWPLWDRERQTFSDKIVGTYVVNV